MKRKVKMSRETLLKPEASPSMPSIRLMALVMKTMERTVNGMPMQGSNAWMPNRPYRLLSHKPESGKKEAQITCMASFWR